MCAKGDLKETAATAKKKETKLKSSVRAAEQCQNEVVGRCVCVCMCVFCF